MNPALHISEANQQFDHFLDSANDPVTICGFCFKPSEAMRAVDPENYEGLFEAWKELQTRPKLELVR